MHLKKILFCLFISFLIFSHSSFSQNVKGKIINNTNNTPIPYATIQIGEHYGVISNEEGSFTIDTDGYKPLDSVHISCLGYEKLGLVLEDFSSKDYYLSEQVNELNEVYLTNRTLSVDSVLYYVNKNLTKNYKKELVNYTLFSRKTDYIKGKDVNFEIDKSSNFNKKQLAAFNKDFDALESALLNNKSKQYTDFVGNFNILNNEEAKLNVEKALRLLDEKNNQSLESLANRGQEIVSKHLDKNKVYTLKSGLFKLSDSVTLNGGNNKMEDTLNSIGLIKKITFDILKRNSFNENSTLDFITENKKYDYEIEDITFIGTEMVYVIGFKPRRSSVDYEGKIYVSNESFAILKADYHFYKGRVGEKVNLKLLLGIKYVEQNRKGSVIFKKGQDNYYYPNYITEQVDRYFYISRPFKFIENDNKKNKVAFDFMVEGTFKEKTELLILSQKPITTAQYNTIIEKEKIEYLTPKRYDENIWEDYNVLAPLEDMKNFKVD
ncbi:carboxypeptidase-like regulatory domain-containing protein [Corallibacter sp.]|uniref:carboxypeptidase-like regulatory domain-containing protein n=1 Tax=Corallibacter sp. TaxID=2038084 RepID=UPI003AB36823